MEADFKKWSMTFYMVIFYTLTTPFGIAIGILIQQSYNANATATLLSTGILDALSAGILIYDVLVNVVAPHFTADNFHNASPIFKFIQLVTIQTAVADHFVIRTSIRADAQGQPPAPRAPTISRHHCLEA
ncbi:hypothetical protein BASA60_005487, partial [Batrachochytrium salamandrivorans]